MKTKSKRSQTKFVIISFVIFSVIALLATQCEPPDSVQVGDSGWDAQRYINFDEVHGNINNLNDLERIYSAWKNIVNGGYVTTDEDGQARMYRPDDAGCPGYVFVFQETTLSGSETVLSTCQRGDACAENATFFLENCDITLTTLPATINFIGTQVTIIENRELESVVVLTSEGSAIVSTVDGEKFEVEENSAAYAVTPELRDKAVEFFRFGPGEVVGFENFVEPIEALGVTPQIQRANLILVGNGLPVIPIPEAYNLQLRWLNDKPEDTRLALAVLYSFEWGPDQEATFAKIPFLFTTPAETLDVREFAVNDPELSAAYLDEGGYPDGFELIITYDNSIPGVEELAIHMAKLLQEYGLFHINDVLQFDVDNAGDLFTELEGSEIPVLVLRGD
jgi:hypothetical protein